MPVGSAVGLDVGVGVAVGTARAPVPLSLTKVLGGPATVRSPMLALKRE